MIQKDTGILLSSLHPESVLEMIDECPVSILKAHPMTILVLMRCMFNWRMIPKMMELKSLLLTSIEEQPEMPSGERGDLLGEYDLIMSFLCYNDISAMSRLHRSASAQMSRTAISIHKSGSWTFGSPSVLMMFHRAPGELKSELAEMDASMLHYYKITDGHGQGAEKIMRAEAAYMQGRFTDARIELEGAYAQIESNGQENMALCCDFLAWRLLLCADVELRYTFEERYAELLRHHNAAWINLWSAISAYYHALLGETEKIPELFGAHRLSSVNILAPGRPMIEMIENQVYLAQGGYAKLIGRSEGLLALCEGMHYALVALHIRVQTAAAYEMLGKTEEAQAWLTRALSDAAQDGFVMPFAENYDAVKPILARESESELIARITELDEAEAASGAVPDSKTNNLWLMVAVYDFSYNRAMVNLPEIEKHCIGGRIGMKKKVLALIMAFVFCAVGMSAATVCAEEQWEAQGPSCVLTSGVQYTGMVPLENDSSWNGGYYYSDMTEDGITVIVNCCAANGTDPDVMDSGYRRVFAEMVSGSEVMDYQDSQNQGLTEKFTYPVYDLSFSTGANEDTRLWRMIFFQTDTHTYAFAFQMVADYAEDMEEEYWNAVDTLDMIDLSYNYEDSGEVDYDPSANGESLEDFIAYFDSWYLCGDLNGESIYLYGDGTWEYRNAIEEDGTGGYLFDDGTFETSGTDALQLYSADGTHVADVSLNEYDELVLTPVIEGYAGFDEDTFFTRETESVAYEAQPVEEGIGDYFPDDDE